MFSTETWALNSGAVISFTESAIKRREHCNGFSIFLLAACLIVRLLDPVFLLVYFGGARRILHFSPQNAPQGPRTKVIIILSTKYKASQY